MGKGLIKELFIVALLIVVIMFSLGVALSEYIPTDENLPEAVEYMADSSVTSALKEISENSEGAGGNGSNGSDTTDSLLKSYTIDQSDLKNYKSKNAFESGKPDPFSDYQAPVDGNTVTNTTTNTTVNSTVTSANKTNSNTGTFFENSGSK